MRKHLLTLSVFLSFTIYANGQDLLGLSTGNYTGVTGMNLNPASIVDSRLKFDLNLIGFSTYFSNNYLSVKRTALLDGSFFKDKYKDWNMVQKDLLGENTLKAGEKVNLRLNTRVIAPISFMLSAGKRSAIAFSINNRTGMYVDNLNQDFARFAYSSFDDNSFFGRNMNMNGINSNTLNWLDVGLTYGTVLIDNGNHFLKGAFTAKYIGGIASGYFQADELNINFTNSQDVNVTTPYMQYGHGNKLSLDMYKSLSLKSLRPEAEGFGWNAGLMYEYRGRIDKFKYLTPEYEEKTRRDYNKYAFRIGFAIMDAGKLTFNKGGFNNDFAMNAVNWNLNNRVIKDINGIDTLLAEQAVYNTLGESSYTVALPTAYSAQLDVHVGRGFYVNAMTYQPMKLSTTDRKVRVEPAYAVTPRFESRTFGFYLPVSYNKFDNWNIGATLRLGPLYVGSSNLGSLVFNKKVPTADIHAGLRIPIAYGSPSKIAKLFDRLSEKPATKEIAIISATTIKDSIITARQKELDSLKMVLYNFERQRLIDSVRLSYLQQSPVITPVPPVNITINNYSGNPEKSTVVVDTVTLFKRNALDTIKIRKPNDTIILKPAAAITPASTEWQQLQVQKEAQTDTLLRLLAEKELRLKELEAAKTPVKDTVVIARDTVTRKKAIDEALKEDKKKNAPKETRKGFFNIFSKSEKKKIDKENVGTIQDSIKQITPAAPAAGVTVPVTTEYDNAYGALNREIIQLRQTLQTYQAQTPTPVIANSTVRETATTQSQNDALKREIESLRNAINNNRNQPVTMVVAPTGNDKNYNKRLEEEISRLRNDLNIYKNNNNATPVYLNPNINTPSQPQVHQQPLTDTVYINDTIRIRDTLQVRDTLRVTDTVQRITTETKLVEKKAVPVVVDNTPDNLVNLQLEKILFNINEVTVKPAYYATLNFIATNLRKYPSLTLKIDGYTDKTGSLTINEKLSRQRAESVKNYLLNKNVPATQLQINNHGPNEPIAENNTKTGQALNRRVELQFVKQ
jgi:outer membrane protein OmpA-like peptidoglycan-associated protein